MVLLQRALEPWLPGRTAQELLDLLEPVLKCSDRLITKSNGASSEPRMGLEPDGEKVMAVYDAQCDLEEAIRNTIKKVEHENQTKT